MNDSPYGLTASIWTADADAAVAIGERVETGTWFHEPLRLPRPRPRLDGRQGLGPRLHALARRLRVAHAPEVLPSAHRNLKRGPMLDALDA